jgi:DNA uptake protein ComE-like DNA-binding protein
MILSALVLFATSIPLRADEPTSVATKTNGIASTHTRATKKTKPLNFNPNCEAPCLDINTATFEELKALSGVGVSYAQKIIQGRPYKAKKDLVIRKIVPIPLYNHINAKLIVK